MNATITVKNGKAQITLGTRTLDIPSIKRDGINAKYQKFAVKSGKLIASVYVPPKSNCKITLKANGDSENAHKFQRVETKGVIVNPVYIAKVGHKMSVR